MIQAHTQTQGSQHTRTSASQNTAGFTAEALTGNSRSHEWEEEEEEEEAWLQPSAQNDTY